MIGHACQKYMVYMLVFMLLLMEKMGKSCSVICELYLTKLRNCEVWGGGDHQGGNLQHCSNGTLALI